MRLLHRKAHASNPLYTQLSQVEGYSQIRIFFPLTTTILHEAVKRRYGHSADAFCPVRNAQNDAIQCLTEA